jgi:hypothetical protein
MAKRKPSFATIASQPGAPYYMAQTIVVQEKALAAAEARLVELGVDVRTPSSKGGFFDGLFGDRTATSRPTGSVPRAGSASRESMQHAGGGGFLAGAAQTALGVTGGVLLGNAIAGMFGGNDARRRSQPRMKPKTKTAKTHQRRLRTTKILAPILVTSTWTFEQQLKAAAQADAGALAPPLGHGGAGPLKECEEHR